MKVSISKNLLQILEEHPVNNKSDNEYYLSILKSPDTTDEQKREAKNILVLNNLKMVLHAISNHYVSVSVNHEDLFMSGVMGLIRAIDKYDNSKGQALSTYAYFWIKKFVNRYLTENTTIIRFPIKVTESLISKKYKEGSSIQDIKKKCKQYEDMPDELIKQYLSYQTVYPDDDEVNIILESKNQTETEYQEEIINLLYKRIEEIPSKIIVMLGI